MKPRRRQWPWSRRRVQQRNLLPVPRRAAVVSGDLTATEAVWRAIQVMVTGVSQLDLTAADERGRAVRVLPSILRNPCHGISLSDWLSEVVISLATDGNAFILSRYDGETVIDLNVLPANEVHVARADAIGDHEYTYRGRRYTRTEVSQLTLVKPAGAARGLSPLAAARNAVSLAQGAGDYAGRWFRDTGHPTGILTTDAAITRQQAEEYRDVWNGLDDEGRPVAEHANPSGIKVLGKGLTFTPIALKPADALWLEAQDNAALTVARVFGIPQSLMLVSVDGGTGTYANVTQEWLSFIRWTLMGYIKPIEETLSRATGLTVRLSLDGLARGDMSARYSAYATAISSGFMTPEYVAQLEGIPL